MTFTSSLKSDFYRSINIYTPCCPSQFSCQYTVNNDTLVSGPLFSSSCCGACGTRPASCSDPRRVSDPHDAERCGRHPSPSYIYLPSCTLRTACVPQVTAFWLSAKLLHSLSSQRNVSLPDALVCDCRNTFVLKGPVQHNRGAYTVPLVS